MGRCSGLLAGGLIGAVSSPTGATLASITTPRGEERVQDSP